MTKLTLTSGPTIARGHLINVYDICDCTTYTVQALEDSEDEVVKVEFDEMYILYAQYETDEDGNNYWEIDSGDCH